LRSLGIVRVVVALIGIAVFWWLQPDLFTQLVNGTIAFDAQPSGPTSHPMFLSAAAILLIGIALRFGLPLILKASLFLPYAAAAASRRIGRGATFDPARDLPADSLAPNSREAIAVDRAIAAALAARQGAEPPELESAPPALVMADRAFSGVAHPAAHPFGRRDAAA
jgi:hypothetical protein